MPTTTASPTPGAKPKKSRHSTQPRFQDLAAQFRTQIQQGLLSPGDSLPSFRDLYAQHGAAPATASRVYAQLEQEGLISRERGRGVFVAERVIASRGTIGFLWHDNPVGASSPYWSSLLEGVKSAAGRAGAQILLFDQAAAMGVRDKIDGLIMVHSFPEPPPLRHLPKIRLLHADPILPSVQYNNHAGLRAATQHLLELGHRRIAYLAGLSQPPTDIDTQRMAGYEAALWDAGIEPQSNWIRKLTGSKTIHDFDMLGYLAMQAWLKDGWAETGCTAVLAWNDDTAIGVITALQEAGLRVPEDVSVVGFDGIRMGALFKPRLTTVEVPLREIGERGVELLLDAQSNPGAKSREIPSIVMPAPLRIGDSTQRLRS